MKLKKMNKTDLSKYKTVWHDERPTIKILWYFVNALFFLNPLNPIISLKVFLLQLFGAKIGKGVMIKPRVNIKYPWLLEIGDYVWIGENVWIDNLGKVKIGNNSCISQGAILLTGNHDYKKFTFDLIVREIILEDGVWIGARAIVCPGVACGSHSFLTAGSVAVKNMEPFTVYQGNPAVSIKKREIE